MTNPVKGLHEGISGRVVGLVKRAGLAEKFVITGGISKNKGMVAKIEEKLGGLKAHVPPEPQIAGAGGQPCSPSTGRGRRPTRPERTSG